MCALPSVTDNPPGKAWPLTDTVLMMRGLFGSVTLRLLETAEAVVFNPMRG